MRIEKDEKNKIIDFYIEDDYGREHHEGMSYGEALDSALMIIFLIDLKAIIRKRFGKKG